MCFFANLLSAHQEIKSLDRRPIPMRLTTFSVRRRSKRQCNYSTCLWVAGFQVSTLSMNRHAHRVIILITRYDSHSPCSFYTFHSRQSALNSQKISLLLERWWNDATNNPAWCILISFESPQCFLRHSFSQFLRHLFLCSQTRCSSWTFCHCHWVRQFQLVHILGIPHLCLLKLLSSLSIKVEKRKLLSSNNARSSTWNNVATHFTQKNNSNIDKPKKLVLLLLFPSCHPPTLKRKLSKSIFHSWFIVQTLNVN